MFEFERCALLTAGEKVRVRTGSFVISSPSVTLFILLMITVAFRAPGCARTECLPCDEEAFFPELNELQQYFPQQCHFDLDGECSHCKLCGRGTYQIRQCSETTATQCQEYPAPVEVTPPLHIELQSPGNVAFGLGQLLTTESVPNKAFTFQQSFGVLALKAFGGTGKVDALLSATAKSAKLATFSTVAGAATSFEAFVIDSVNTLNQDWLKVRVLVRAFDRLGNTKLSSATTFKLKLTQGARNPSSSTCKLEANSAETKCTVALDTTWLTGDAINVAGNLEGFDELDSLGEVQTAKFEEHVPKRRQVWARLPDQPLYPGETFTVPLVAKAGNLLRAGKIKLEVGDVGSFEFVSRSTPNKNFDYPELNREGVPANVVTVSFTAKTSAKAKPGPDDVQVISAVTFKVLGGAAAKQHTVKVPILELGDPGQVLVPPIETGGSQPADVTGKLTVRPNTPLRLFAALADGRGEVVNIASLTNKTTSAGSARAIAVFGKNGAEVQVAAGAGLACATKDADGVVSVELDCSAITFSPSQTSGHPNVTVVASYQAGGKTVQAQFPLRVWFPRAPFRVVSEAPRLAPIGFTDLTPFSATATCSDTIFAQTRITVSTTFATSEGQTQATGAIANVDITKLLHDSGQISVANESVAGLEEDDVGRVELQGRAAGNATVVVGSANDPKGKLSVPVNGVDDRLRFVHVTGLQLHAIGAAAEGGFVKLELQPSKAVAKVTASAELVLEPIQRVGEAGEQVLVTTATFFDPHSAGARFDTVNNTLGHFRRRLREADGLVYS